MARQRGKHLRLLLRVARVLLALLAFRVLAGIIYEYQWYFPPNFQASGFLAGREAFFHGAYRFAFYSHIVCGPFTILIVIFLAWSGRRNVYVGIHRCLGKVQFLLVVIVLAPSGLVMATRAYTGFVAGAGFALLSIMTLAAAILTVIHAKHGNMHQHRRWSNRLFILLISPIALRITSGFIIMFGVESILAYRISAWASWLIPLIAFEIWHRNRFRISDESHLQPKNLDRVSSIHMENVL